MFNNLLIPSWYWEGDAVDVETAFSNSGRGRVPYFDILTRSLILSGSKPSYRQVLFGSYKNIYPDHYEMGYMLTRHIKSQYNTNSINEILTKTLRRLKLLDKENLVRGSYPKFNFGSEEQLIEQLGSGS